MSSAPAHASAPPRPRAALYVVLPSDGAKVRAATERLDAFARSQGFVVAVTYAETDRRRRAARERLLARARTGAFDVVCVLGLDHLAAPRSAVVGIVRDLEAVAVRVVAANGTTLDPANPGVCWLEGAALRHRERVKRALDAKRERGERVGGVPYGCRLAEDGVTLERDEAEQRTIERIVALRADGWSLREIGMQLAQEGYLSRSSARFGHNQVARILKRSAAG